MTPSSSFHSMFRAVANVIALTLLFGIVPSCALFADSGSRTGESSGASSQGITLVLTCSDDPCRHETSTVTVTFSGFPGNATDAIRIGSPDALATSEIDHQLTHGATSGVVTFTRLPAGMPLVAGALINGVSNVIAAQSPLPALTLVDDARIQIACAAPCDRSSAVTVTFQHLPGNTYDTIAITPLDGTSIDRIAVVYTNGAVDGTLVVNANLPSGTPFFPNTQQLVARVFENNYGGPQIAVSNPITLGGPDVPTVKVDCGPCLQSSPVTVSYSDLPGFFFDYITVVPQGGGDGEPFRWQYLGAAADGSITLTGLIADDWLVARAYKNQGTTLLAESAPFKLRGSKSTVTVSCPPDPSAPVPSTSCANRPRSTPVTVQFANMPGYFYDTITFAPKGAPNDSRFFLLNWTQGQVNGSLTFTGGLPSGVPIVARGFKDYSANGTSILVAESDAFTLTGGPPTLKLKCSTDPCYRSSKVTVDYAGLSGFAYDIITFYKEGAPLGNGFSSYQYTYGNVDGSATFTDLPIGRIFARALKNLDFNAMEAKSDVLTILPNPGDLPTITVGCAPHCIQTDDVVVTYSHLQSFYYSSIYAYTYPDNAVQSSTLYFQQGASAGTFNMGKLPVGTYRVASDMDPNGVPFGESAPFTVGPLVPVCGDGVRDPTTEECDDGNLSSGDACSPACKVTASNAAPRSQPSGAPPLPGRTLGDGRHPIAAQDRSFAATFVQSEPAPTLSFVEYSSFGVPVGVPLAIGQGTSVLSTSNPVIAALPGNRYAAAWTDLASGTMGDGDGQGIALRLIDPATALNTVGHANTHGDFSQFDPDIVFTGTDVVVAWVDESNFATKRDIRYRLFSSDLAPRGGELTLAGTADSEGDVALATFAGSWAAAWRTATSDGEIVHVKAANVDWSVGPFLPGPAGTKPALSALDATHMLLVLTEGVDVGNTGVANGSKLSAVVLDVATPGAVTANDIAMSLSSAIGANRPTLARVERTLYLGWESASSSGAPFGQHVWVKKLPWSGATLDGSLSEAPIARDPAHRIGDQQHPTLCETSLAVDGGVLAAWDDLGMSFANSKGEAALQLNPLPW